MRSWNLASFFVPFSWLDLARVRELYCIIHRAHFPPPVSISALFHPPLLTRPCRNQRGNGSPLAFLGVGKKCNWVQLPQVLVRLADTPGTATALVLPWTDFIGAGTLIYTTFVEVCTFHSSSFYWFVDYQRSISLCHCLWHVTSYSTRCWPPPMRDSPSL